MPHRPTGEVGDRGGRQSGRSQSRIFEREFVRYVEIALREAREASYWLRIFVALELASSPDANDLGGEADQIARILGSIVVKTKLRMRVGYAVFAFCILNFALVS